MEMNQSYQGPIDSHNEESMFQKTSGNHTLYAIAYGFMIVATIISAFAIIPMAWMIPMTLATKKAMEEAGSIQEVSHVGLGVCTLIFAGLVSGILILVASANVNK